MVGHENAEKRVLLYNVYNMLFVPTPVEVCNCTPVCVKISIRQYVQCTLYILYTRAIPTIHSCICKESTLYTKIKKINKSVNCVAPRFTMIYIHYMRYASCMYIAHYTISIIEGTKINHYNIIYEDTGAF